MALDEGAKKHAEWVIDLDPTRKAQFERLTRAGTDAFDALVTCQDHNRNAQEVLRRHEADLREYLRGRGFAA